MDLSLIHIFRAEAEAAPSKKLTAVILAQGEKLEVMKAGERYIKDLANITEIHFVEEKQDVPEEVMSAVIDGVEIFIPLDDLVDFNAEFDRLTKETKKLEGEVKRVVGKLSNEGFLAKRRKRWSPKKRKKRKSMRICWPRSRRDWPW